LFNRDFTFSEHLGELRKRVRVVVLSFLIIFIIVVLFPANPILSVQNPSQYLNLSFLSNTIIAAFLRRVVHDILPAGWTLIAANGLGEGMEVYFVASLVLTLALDMPVIAYETYKFVDPALTERERKMVYPFVTSATVLFIVGLAFGYFVLAKFLVVALAPFFQATQTAFLLDSAAFYYVIFLIIGATGASFTAPVFVYTLIRLRVIDADFFSKNRVIIWFVIWVITGLFLTPDGGPLLDLVIFIPIVVLVELAVSLGRRSVRGQVQEGKVKSGKSKCHTCGASLDGPVLFCPKCGCSVV
jgi:sec-independent protein translocase protein TatC